MVAAGLAACAKREHAQAPAPAPEPAAHAVHWSYSGPTGPAYWGTLSPEFALCATGRSQSPIDIASAAPRDLPNIEFRYQPSPLSIVNNGHTVQVVCAPGSFITLEGERFDLQQFHFHLPSEHTVRGAHADAEMHLVHKSAAGRLAVVGVMLREGAANPAFDVVAGNLPQAGQKIDNPKISVNPASLLPADQRTYRYDGSLTTPPGTEGVRWCVMVEPVSMSSSQFAAFRALYTGNNRPVQNLNGRAVIEDTTR